MSQEFPKQENPKHDVERLDLRLTERDLADFQRQLSALQPASHLDREELLYLAGQESMRRGPLGRFGPQGRFGRWFWPSSTAALSLVCAGLVALAIVRGQPHYVDRVVHVPVYDPPEPESVLAGGPGQSKPGSILGSAPASVVRRGQPIGPGDYFRFRHSLATFSPLTSELFSIPTSENPEPARNEPEINGTVQQPMSTPVPPSPRGGEGYLDELHKLLNTVP